MKDTTYIVILNWNNWQDTIACLESVFATTDADYKIIVCDNASSDNSLNNIQLWAKRELEAQIPDNPKLASLVGTRPVPLPYQLIKSSRLEERLHEPAGVLTLIDNEANVGFAAGNNSGFRYAMAQADMTHIWLLNNDTLVEADCLANMLQRLQVAGPRAVCGSRLMFFDDPTVIQAIGGNRFNHWTGNASQSLGRYLPESTDIDQAGFEAQLDYICGASMLLPRLYLEEIGLMEEGYFLYYEEIDWARRAAGKFSSCVALDAVVYHKEGSSIGSASFNRGPSLLSEFYMFRNKLRFTWRFFPYAWPICYCVSWLQVLNRLRRGRWKNAALLSKILLGKSSFQQA